MRANKFIICLTITIALVVSSCTIMVWSIQCNNAFVFAEPEDDNNSQTDRNNGNDNESNDNEETSTPEPIETPPPAAEPDPPSLIIQNIPGSMEVGETASLSYTLKNGSGDASWSSSDPDIISVDSSGQIKAEGPGTAEITAQAGGASDTTSITVTEVAAESIRIVADEFNVTNNFAAYEMKKGETIRLSVQAKPENSTYGSITWEVSNNEVAEIDQNGRLVALENGKVTVTATTEDDLEAQVDIKVGSIFTIIMIAGIILLALIIIILIILVIRKKMRDRRRRKPEKSNKYDDDDYDDDEYDNRDDGTGMPPPDNILTEEERIRQDAYRQGYLDREKEMTRVYKNGLFGEDDTKKFDPDDED